VQNVAGFFSQNGRTVKIAEQELAENRPAGTGRKSGQKRNLGSKTMGFVKYAYVVDGICATRIAGRM
jgi:hypothetical protein